MSNDYRRGRTAGPRKWHRSSADVRFRGFAVGAVIVSVVLAACTPGSSESPTPGQTASKPVSTDLGSDPVTLRVETDNSGSNQASLEELGAAFQKKYPNVTVDIITEQFTVLQQNGPRIISTPDTPDLIRFPTLGNTVKDGLLANLDPYAAAYGWDKFPATQLDQWRVSADGSRRGSGSLYGMGLSFSLTGTYYNKEEAAAIGMTTPPATVADFEAMLAKAKAAGKVPLLSSGQDGNLFLIFQALMLSEGAKEQLSDWVFNEPGATIDTPEALDAATTLVEWTDAGYLPSDVNAINNTEAVARFNSGDAVFIYDGNWNTATYNKEMGENVGFFLLPPSSSGGKSSSMSDPFNYVIPAKAANKDAAAAFLNFAYTNEGRAIMVETTGQVPGGPADADVPTTGAGPVIQDTLTAFQQLNTDDGIAPYIGNATASIYTDTIIPQFQLLVAGKVSPADFVKRLQSDYTSQLAP